MRKFSPPRRGSDPSTLFDDLEPIEVRRIERNDGMKGAGQIVLLVMFYGLGLALVYYLIQLGLPWSE